MSILSIWESKARLDSLERVTSLEESGGISDSEARK